MRFEFDVDTLRPVIQQVVAETLSQLEAERSQFDGRIAYTEPEAAALLGVNVVLAVLLFFIFDRGRLIRGAGREAEGAARRRLLEARRRERREALARALGERAVLAAAADETSEGGE